MSGPAHPKLSALTLNPKPLGSVSGPTCTARYMVIVCLMTRPTAASKNTKGTTGSRLASVRYSWLPRAQGLTLVHVRAQLEHLWDTSIS